MLERTVPQGAVERLWYLASARDRNVRYLYADTAWQGIIAAGIAAFLAVFLVRLGASNLYVGLLTSLPALVTVLVSVPVSAIVERRQDLVGVVVWSRILLRLSYLLIALVPFFFLEKAAIVAVVIVWGLSAIPTAVSTSAWTAVVAEIIPARDRPYVNGNRWAVVSIITAVTVAIFGKLLDSVVFPLNYQIVFATSFGAGMLGVYYFSLIRTSATGRPTAEARPQLRFLRAMASISQSIVASKGFARYVVATFVYRLGLYLPTALFAIYWVQNLEATDTFIGLRATMANATLVIGFIMWGRVAGRYGNRLVLLACGVGLSLYPVLTSFVQSPLWLLPVAAVWGAFTPGIEIAFFESLLRLCPADHRPSFAAVNATFANLAMVIAPITGTLLADMIGIGTVFLAAGAISMFGTLLFSLLAIGTESNSEDLTEVTPSQSASQAAEDAGEA